MVLKRFILILKGLKQKKTKLLKTIKTNIHTFPSFTIINAKLEILYHLEISINVTKPHTHTYTGLNRCIALTFLLFKIIFPYNQTIIDFYGGE